MEIVEAPGRAPDNEFPGRCVTIKEANPNRPTMSIFKSVKELKCTVAGPCRYDVTISNFGPQYNGPIEFIDEIPEVGVGGKAQSQPAGVEAVADPDWDCQKLDPRHLKCTFKKQAIGSSGANVTLPILVTPGPGWKKNDTLQNCVTLKVAEGTIGNGERRCAEYSLDPFNVKVSKTGDQTCELGRDCHFNLTLFNPGPIDHNAPVTISDNLTGLSAAQIVSISPPLPCATQPTSIPFTCTSPGNVSLPLGGAPQVFNMVVRLPNDATAKQFTNCAKVAASRSDLSSGNDASCATVTTKPPGAPAADAVSISKSAVTSECGESGPCAFLVTIRNTSEKPVPGPISFYDTMSSTNGPMSQVKLASAPPAPWVCVSSAVPGMQCSHPGPIPSKGSLSMAYSMQPLPGSLEGLATLKNCAKYEGAPVAELCVSASVPKPEAPLPVVTPPPGRCFGGMIMVGNLCRCPPGERFNGRVCVGEGDGDGGWNGSRPGDETASPPGRVKPPIVVLPPVRTEQTECPRSRPVGVFPDCCPRGMEFRNGRCRLPRGEDSTTPSRSGDDDSPRRKKPPKVCPPQRPIGEYPDCCPVGTEFRNGECRGPRKDPGQGTGGPYPNKQGGNTKTCPNGRIVFKYMQCPDDKPQPRKCPPGYRVLDRPNKYGAYCEPVQQGGSDGNKQGGGGSNGNKQGDGGGKCPTWAPEGRPPNCHCPAGTVRRGNFCGPATCGPGMTGTPPNCHRVCPDGTVNQDETCVPRSNPKPVPKPQPGPPPKPHCSGGKIPRSPDGVCVCPGGTTDRGGQCVGVVR